MKTEEKDFFKMLDNMLLEQLTLKEATKKNPPEIKAVAKTPEEQAEVNKIVKNILDNMKVIPTLNVADFVGQNANVEGETQRKYSEALLSKITEKGSTFEERLKWISSVLSEEKVLSESEFMSTLVFLKTLKELIENYRETVAGSLFENFFAQMAGGESLADTKIEDVIVGNKLYSLKLLGEKSPITGSLTNLIKALIRHPQGVNYVVAFKGKGLVTDFDNPGDEAKIVASVKFYERLITMDYIKDKLKPALEKGRIDFSDALIAAYSTKKNNLGTKILDTSLITSPAIQMRNFLTDLDPKNPHDARLVKELLFDLMADNGGKAIYGTGFSGGEDRGEGLQFSITQASFVKDIQPIGSIDIAAERLYSFYKKNSTNIYNSYIEILKRVSEQTNSINKYLTTGLPSEGATAVSKTEETKAMLDSSIRAGKNV
jgi:hypothetical protein